MGPLMKAIIPAALLTEIAAIVFFTATWSILAEMHFGSYVTGTLSNFISLLFTHTLYPIV